MVDQYDKHSDIGNGIIMEFASNWNPFADIHAISCPCTGQPLQGSYQIFVFWSNFLSSYDLFD
jgi:hypothetical protein